MNTLPRNQVLRGDATDVLAGLLAESVDCVVTSPPYFQLRDYDAPGQLGLERTVGEWAEGLRAVFRAVARVLKPHGTLWLNLGDTYSHTTRTGAPPKGLLLAPERLLLALAEDGWICRNKIVWAKRNPMPHSVADRLSSTWEPVYLLTRQPRYFFDLDAIREPYHARPRVRGEQTNGRYQGGHGGLARLKATGRSGHLLGKNPGDVWSLPKATYRGAHFATFPEQLVERPILAGCPERICVQCDRAWRRQVTARRVMRSREHGSIPSGYVRRYRGSYDVVRERGELIRCDCFAPTRPGIVLDPFFGTGTVGVVAKGLKRDWLGIELNPEYARMAEARLGIGSARTEPPAP